MYVPIQKLKTRKNTLQKVKILYVYKKNKVQKYFYE